MKPEGNGTELSAMIADYMEAGFLENIIDMFRHDSALYVLIGELIRDERVRVRIGVTALIEELKRLDSGNISKAVPGLLTVLRAGDPVHRGDAVNLLGVIGDRSAGPELEKALSDENPDVRLLAREALDELSRRHSRKIAGP